MNCPPKWLTEELQERWLVLFFDLMKQKGILHPFKTRGGQKLNLIYWGKRKKIEPIRIVQHYYQIFDQVKATRNKIHFWRKFAVSLSFIPGNKRSNRVRTTEIEDRGNMTQLILYSCIDFLERKCENWSMHKQANSFMGTKEIKGKKRREKFWTGLLISYLLFEFRTS